MQHAALRDDELLSTGVAGMDSVLGGGLTARRLYLLEGTPGAGKTTLALQFLRAGADRGEAVLYLTLSETAEEMRGVAHSHGWSLAGITVREMLPSEAELDPQQQATVFQPSEMELSQTTLRILDDVQAIAPTRVVFDSLSELRLLAGSSLRYRRQILALKQFFAGRNCTVLLLDDMTAVEHDLQVQSIAHGVIRLEQSRSAYGTARRRLSVTKYRGKAFREGWHDYKIATGGLQVFPRLVAADYVAMTQQPRLASGLATLDSLLGGGIEKGTSTLLVGAPGTGKSTLAMQYALAAGRRGECAALFLFDESVATLTTRCEGMGMPIAELLDAGRLRIRQVDPAQMSPGEFVHHLQAAVQEQHATVIVIDSLNGYLHAMPDERFLIAQLHEILTYLGQAGVATLLVGAHHGIIGMNMQTPVDASYLADAVVLLRFYESEGQVLQAISVVKKRGGHHERSIRSLQLTSQGIVIGEPLARFRGVLTGVPVPIDDQPEAHRPWT